jgi:hypothetical protein
MHLNMEIVAAGGENIEPQEKPVWCIALLGLGVGQDGILQRVCNPPEYLKTAQAG